MTGTIQNPNLDFYWIKDAFFETQIFKRMVSRKCHRQLKTMIHISDPLSVMKMTY